MEACSFSSQEESQPLGFLFKEASNIHERADSLPIEDSKAEAERQRALRLLQICKQRISTLGLFSPNEEADDVATGDLKYLLVAFIEADIVQRLMGEERLASLQAAQEHFKAFVLQCRQLGIVATDEAHAEEEHGAPMDAMTQRSLKVARFKRQRVLERQLAALEERRQGQRKRSTSGREEGDAGEGDAEDDPYERQVWLFRIQLALNRALDLEDTISREVEMLRAAADMARMEPDGKARAELDRRQALADEFHRLGTQSAASLRSPAPVPISCSHFARDVIEGRASVRDPHHHHHHRQLAAPGMVFGPASVLGGRASTERQLAAARVFQPSHSLPTMSIEEAGLKERDVMSVFSDRNSRAMAEAGADANMRVGNGAGIEGRWGSPADVVGGSDWRSVRVGRGSGTAARGSSGRPRRGKVGEVVLHADDLAGAGSGEEESEVSEDEREEDLRERKAREWDDWRDDHPRGQGNSKLTPCG